MLVGPSLSGRGFLGCQTKTNSTQCTKSTKQTKPACQKCGKKHNEGGLNVSNDECDEQTHEHANESITHKILTEKILPKNKYRKVIHKLKRKNVSVVFNVSNLVLTESMEKLLNRGFKFAILPLKLDLTQVLVDYKRFERSMIWHEFWFGTPPGENTYKPPLFKSKKNNLPKNHRSPNGLKTFLGAIKSEIQDPQKRNKVKCNLPDDEIKALGELIRLQKERKITIKPCVKRAGIIVLNFEDYVQACNTHLKQTLQEKQYYSKVDNNTFEKAKQSIQHIIEEGLDQEYLTKAEYDAMSPQC